MRRNKMIRAFSAILSAAMLFSCTPDPGAPSAESRDSSDVSPGGAWTAKETVNFGGKNYDIAGSNHAPVSPGIYYFDRSEGAVSAPKQSGDYTDCAVCGGVICAIYKNRPAVIPECGFVVRVFGSGFEREPEIGDSMRYSLKNPPYTPERYVKIGGINIPVGYKNVVRIDENTGFVFDSGWYNSTTKSNRHGTEIAVDASGTVVEINPSGTDDSGDTFIPEGGFVLAAGQGSSVEYSLKDVKIGDKAEYIEEKHLYTLQKFTVGSKKADGSRADDSLLYLSGDDYKSTPAGNGTDVIIGADGRITAVLKNTAGSNAIPEGGHAVCASGKFASALANAGREGDICVLNGAKTLCFITNPEVIAKRYGAELEDLNADYLNAVGELRNIDYRAAAADIISAKNALERSKSDPTALLSLGEALDSLATSLIPCVIAGERAAWVTLGELDYSGNPYLHYYDDESVKRTVAYAEKLNLNTLIIDNLASGYTVYSSEIAGLVKSPVLGDFDLIASFSKACAEKNIRLIVMVSALMSVSAATDYPDEHYINLYSDCVIRSKKGATVDSYGAKALDPSRPEVRKLVTDMVTEIAENYPGLYGIQTDYIRYPLPIYYQKANYEDFGYDSPAAESFKKRFGIDPEELGIDDKLWPEWCAARREVITSLAKEISGAIRAVDPDISVSFTCFSDYNDRQLYVYQEPEKWAQSGIADAIYPMIYQSDTESQLKYALQIAEAAGSARVVLGVGTYVRASEKSMAEQLYMPYELGYYGASTFTLRYIATCGYNGVYEKAYRFPAEPEGAKAALGFLLDRYAKLTYIFPSDAGLKSLIDVLEKTVPEQISVQELKELLETLSEGCEFGDEKLKTAFEHDLNYAKGLLK